MKTVGIEVCPECRGSGWVVQVGAERDEVVRCPECSSKLRTQRLLANAKIPPRYLSRGFDVYSIHHPLQGRALRRAIEYVEAFPAVPRGLLFLGPCGVGKTHLAVAILKAVVQANEVSARFVDEAELLRRLMYSYGPDSPETERELLLPLLSADLVVWDDLGTGRPTEWVAETIRTVLNHRYTYNKQTILTSNWPVKTDERNRLGTEGRNRLGKEALKEQSLSERIGLRLYSRIMEMCELLELDGPDARTEIHKAGLDFQQDQSQGSTINLPAGILRCTKCESRQVRPVDYSRPRGSGENQHVEVSCLCEDCNEHFLARFFSQGSRVEYPGIAAS